MTPAVTKEIKGETYHLIEVFTEGEWPCHNCDLKNVPDCMSLTNYICEHIVKDNYCYIFKKEKKDE